MKRLILILATLFHSCIYCCQVEIKNDSKTWVSVKDLNSPDKSFKTVPMQYTILANNDPKQHARLIVMIGPQAQKPTRCYRVNQVACSDSHTISICSSKIETGMSGKLLKFIPINKKRDNT